MKKHIALSLTFSTLFLVGCFKSQNADVSFDLNFSDVNFSDATARVEMELDGNGTIEAKGIMYNMDSASLQFDNVNHYYYNEPEKEVYLTSDGGGEGAFEVELNNLLPTTRYYVRPYAVVDGLLIEGDIKSFVTGCPPLGCGPAGGYIIYDDGAGGGIEAAPRDAWYYLSSYETTYWWGCDGVNIGTTETGIGEGYNNSNEIIANCTYPVATQQCLDVEINGYSDWYLPSQDELILVYSILAGSGVGGFREGYYWSSSEIDAEKAIAISMITGDILNITKSYHYHIRPVRTF